MLAPTEFRYCRYAFDLSLVKPGYGARRRSRDCVRDSLERAESYQMTERFDPVQAGDSFAFRRVDAFESGPRQCPPGNPSRIRVEKSVA
jgi:hypothetical protein